MKNIEFESQIRIKNPTHIGKTEYSTIFIRCQIHTIYMFNKKLLIFSIILVILAAGAVSAHDNTTDTITENATVQNDEKTFKDVQLAIDNSEENSTVELEGTYIGNRGEITINKSITIDGKNHTILDADDGSGIIKISDVTVCLKNINFINSYSETLAAITCDGNLSLENCYFKNNIRDFTFDEYEHIYDEDNAGAVLSKGTLSVNNCTFENNHAKGTEIIESQIHYEDDDYDEIIEYEYYEYAGAISALGELTISNSHFIDSTVSASQKSTIINSSFRKSNRVLKINGDSSLINCNFTQNSDFIIHITYHAENVNIENCYFTDNNPKSSGHPTEDTFRIFTGYGNLTVLNSIFKGSARSSIHTYGNVILINSSFYDNNETAVCCDNITAINCTFKNNKDNFSAGLYGRNIYLANNTFTNNRACAVIASELINLTGSIYVGQTALNDQLNAIDLISIKTVTSQMVYASGKYPQIKAIYQEIEKAAFYHIKYQIFKGNKLIKNSDKFDDSYYAMTNSKGIITLKFSNYKVGTYKIKIYGVNYLQYKIPVKTITVKITKAKTVIKAPKITVKYKKSKYFKISVKHATTKKVVKNTYIKVKIGKKTYNVKTNSNGIAKINTKKLKLGKHKVSIFSGNSNYQMSAKSLITVKR